MLGALFNAGMGLYNAYNAFNNQPVAQQQQPITYIPPGNGLPVGSTSITGSLPVSDYGSQPRRSYNGYPNNYTGGTGISPFAGYGSATFGSTPYYQGGLTMQGPQVGGYAYAPGYGQAQARMAAQQYQQAYNEARNANMRRANEVGGFNNPFNALPMRTQRVRGGSVQQVNIGGQWKRLDEVTPQDTQAINQMVARNSQFEPLMGGYYGRYARGMNDVADMGGISDYLAGRGDTAMGYINGMGGVAQQYNQRTQTGQDLLGGLYPVLQQYANRTATGMNMAQNLGLQARNDINRQYDNLAHGETTDLAARGLGNSTVAASVRQAVEADRAQAIGRLNDSLMQNQLNTYGTLSGQQLGFASQIPQLMAQNYGQLSGQALDYAGQIPRMQASTYLQTSGDQANWLQNYGQLKLNTDQQLSGDMLRFAENINEPYPNPGMYQQSRQAGVNYDAQRALLAQLQNYYGYGGY